MRLTGLIGGALVLVLSAIAGAEAAEWQHVSTDTLGNQRYVETGSVAQLSKDVIQVLEKNRYSDKGRTEVTAKFGAKYADIAYSLTLSEYNCATRELRPTSHTDYSSQGTVIATAADKNSAWTPVTPGSIAETVYMRLCSPKGTK
jgi:hypothetical protein